MKPTVTVDIGTTRVKLGFFDSHGNQQSSTKQATPQLADSYGLTYDVDGLFSMVFRFLRNLDPIYRQSVERITIGGVGESGGLVGPDLRLRSPMILWHDQRGASLLERFSAADHARIYRITGLPVNANHSLSKIAWAVDHLESDAGDVQWLNVSEYLAAHLSGQRWAEYSLASRTMALNVNTGQWSEEMCQLAGVDPTILPRLRSAATGFPITAEMSRQTGLSPEVMVHVVGHDHMVGAVGADLQPGELLNSTGTTEGLLMLRDQPSLDDASRNAQLSNGIACDQRHYSLFASIPTGGSAFETLQRMLGMSGSMLGTLLDALNERYLTGSIDYSRVPIVIPYFRGSPPPEKSATARGLIANLSSDVQAEEIVFGCFLGLAVQFWRVLELFGTDPSRIKVIGPASENLLWLHLKADLLGSELSVSRTQEVVSKGGQALASQQRSDWLECHPWQIEPNPARQQVLREWYHNSRAVTAGLGALSW